jgi:hypothetical protein
LASNPSHEDAGHVPEEESAFRASSTECIANALTELLGSAGAEAVMMHLELDYGIRREQIPVRPREFAQGIRSMFGSGGELLISAVSNSLSKSMPKSSYLTEFIGALQPKSSHGGATRTRAFRSGF